MDLSSKHPSWTHITKPTCLWIWCGFVWIWYMWIVMDLNMDLLFQRRGGYDGNSYMGLRLSAPTGWRYHVWTYAQTGTAPRLDHCGSTRYPYAWNTYPYHAYVNDWDWDGQTSGEIWPHVPIEVVVFSLWGVSVESALSRLLGYHRWGTVGIVPKA